jgi:uncharacterized protein YggE
MTDRPRRLPRTPPLAGLVLLLVAAGCTAAPASAPAAAPDARIVVTGEAEVRAAPDRARFDVGVTTRGREAEAVLDANAERAEALLDALRGAGIALESLSTRGVRLNPVWSPRPRDADDDWTPSIAGYSATNRVEVETKDLARVGELLAVAATAGANDLAGVHFDLEDDADARERAIEEATADALREADVLARAAGVSRGGVIELRLDHARTDLPRPAAMAMDGRAESMAMRAVPVEPGEITVRASVTLVVGIR